MTKLMNMADYHSQFFFNFFNTNYVTVEMDLRIGIFSIGQNTFTFDNNGQPLLNVEDIGVSAQLRPGCSSMSFTQKKIREEFTNPQI